jgi:hypothetical protein
MPASISNASRPAWIALDEIERISTVTAGWAAQKGSVNRPTSGMAAGITPSLRTPLSPPRRLSSP